MTEHPLEVLANRYPQLYLPVKEGMRDTELYKDTVLRGKKPEGRLVFSLSAEDSLSSVSTPAGNVDVLFLRERKDFEHAVLALAYRCEMHPLPASMGATTIKGLINWEKINTHLEQYEAEGNSDINAEFARFTADKANYTDAIILLSAGEYSAVPAEKLGLGREEWIERSITIRKYHELTHFYSGRAYPQNKEAIRDEIIADLMGITAAFGEYDPELAKLFLGIEGSSYRDGGRLQNYSGEEEISSVMKRALAVIDELNAAVKAYGKPDNIFKLLDAIETDRVGTL